MRHISFGFVVVEGGNMKRDEVFDEIIRMNPSLEEFISYIRGLKFPPLKEYQLLLQSVKAGELDAQNRLAELYLKSAVVIAYHRSRKYGVEIEDSISDTYTALVYAIKEYDEYVYKNPNEFLREKIYQWLIYNQKLGQGLLNINSYSRYGGVEIYQTLKNSGFYEYKDTEDILNECFEIYEGYERNENRMIKAYTAVNLIGSDLYEIEELLSKYYCDYDISVVSDKSCLDYQSIDDIIALNEMRKMMSEILQTLTVREREWLVYRYGIEDGIYKTLEEVGYKYRYTRERGRQVTKKGLRKLRHPSRSRKIKGFLYDN